MPDPDLNGNPTVDPWAGVAQDLRDNPSIKDFKTPADVVKAYISVQPLIGADKLVVPGPNATPEDWGKVYEKLGRPASAGDYDFSASPLPPEFTGMKGTDVLEAGFKEIAHEIGLSSANATKLREWYLKTNSELIKGFKGELDAQAGESKKALLQKWGEKYPSNFESIKRLLERFGNKDALDILDSRQPVVLGDSLPVLEMLLAITGVMSEDVLRLPSKGPDQTTIQDAQKKIDTIMNDKTHVYWSRDPLQKEAHDRAVAEVAALQSIITPEVRPQ